MNVHYDRMTTKQFDYDNITDKWLVYIESSNKEQLLSVIGDYVGIHDDSYIVVVKVINRSINDMKLLESKLSSIIKIIPSFSDYPDNNCKGNILK